jgi:transglutaminase-like putative cysteine protease
MKKVNKEQKDSGISIEVESEIVPLFELDYSLKSTGLSLLLVLLGVYGMVAPLLADISIGNIKYIIYIIIPFVCIAFLLILQNKTRVNQGILCIALGLSVFVFAFKERLSIGYNKIYSLAISIHNIRFNKNIKPPIEFGDMDVTLEVNIFLIFVIVLICLILSVWVAYRPKTGFILAAYVPFLMISMALGRLPNVIAFISVMMCVIGLYLKVSSNRLFKKKKWFLKNNVQYNYLKDNKDYKSVMEVKISLYAWIGVFLSVVVLSLILAVPLQIFLQYNGESLRKNLDKTPVMASIQGALKSYYSPFRRIMAGQAVGGIGDGRLDNISHFEFSGEEHLKVTIGESLSMESNDIYMKAFSGETYEDNRWTPLVLEKQFLQEYGQEMYDFAYNFLEDMQANEIGTYTEESITISNLKANPNYTYQPYFSEGAGLDDQMDAPVQYFDGYLLTKAEKDNLILNGGKEFELYIHSDKFKDEYEKFVYDEYLQLPEHGPERFLEEMKNTDMNISTHSLGEISNYVKERVQRDTVYSLSPGSLLEGKDFVDNFLYDQKEGFCNHFSTTATLMFRAFGVPARQAMGYVATPSMFEENETGEYEAMIEDRFAHSWTEIYVDDIGWIPVDYTPVSVGTAMDSNETEVQEEEQKNENTPALENISKVFTYVVIFLLILIVILIIRIVRKNRKRHRRKGLPKTNWIIKNKYIVLHKAFIIAGLPKDKNITQEDVKAFAKEHMRSFEEESWNYLMNCVQEANYSSKELSDVQVEEVKRLSGIYCRELYKGLNSVKKMQYLVLTLQSFIEYSFLQ